jgi:predicted HNH restriction endonuclease
MNASLMLGKNYSRTKISELLGGEMVIYLPAKNGKVTAGCFDPKLNRRAPKEIDIGNRPEAVKRAIALGKAKSEIPVFLKRRANQWEYVGNYRCNLFSQEKKDIEAYPDRRKDAVGVLYFEEAITRSKEIALDSELLEFRANEGKQRLVIHLRRERSRDLIIAKRNEVRVEKGCLVCEACKLRERTLPKHIGEACFEVHHKTPLTTLTEQIEIRLADVSLLCANCHRMIHRSDPMMTVDELQKHLGA